MKKNRPVIAPVGEEINYVAMTNWNLSGYSVIIKMFFQSFFCRIN